MNRDERLKRESALAAPRVHGEGWEQRDAARRRRRPLAFSSRLFPWLAALCLLAPALLPAASPDGLLSAKAYPNIQAALDANPGQMIFVPPGDYVLSAAIRLEREGAGLFGPGRLVQTDPHSPHLHLRGAQGARIRDLRLARPPDRSDCFASAILAEDCTELTLEGLKIRDNRSAASTIRLRQCTNSEVVRCTIENYMTLSVDDRTRSPHYGYAFNCIDGTGIGASNCRGLSLAGNRIVEQRLRPTPELQARHHLGQFVKRAPTKGALINPKTWHEGSVNNWHQGSAIAVTSPEGTAFVRVLDNHIENAAQGIDLHADCVTVTGNQVVNAFVGMKAMHGSQHVLIANNQFVRNDLWSIGLMPGTGSHSAAPARAANVDGGTIVANNIISEFGYGDAHWMWDPQRFTCAPILLDHGQEPEDPPLHDVILTGNLVYASGRDRTVAGDGAKPEPPRYRYAVFVSREATGPRGLHFSNNLFHAGTEGVSNVELKP